MENKLHYNSVLKLCCCFCLQRDLPGLSEQAYLQVHAERDDHRPRAGTAELISAAAALVQWIRTHQILRGQGTSVRTPRTITGGTAAGAGAPIAAARPDNRPATTAACRWRRRSRVHLHEVHRQHDTAPGVAVVVLQQAAEVLRRHRAHLWRDVGGGEAAPAAAKTAAAAATAT